MTTTFTRLCTVLTRDYKLPLDRLTPDTPLASLGIDSLGTVELLWTLEAAFHIKLPTTAGDLTRLGDVVAFIDTLLQHQHGHAGAPATVPAA